MRVVFGAAAAVALTFLALPVLAIFLRVSPTTLVRELGDPVARDALPLSWAIDRRLAFLPDAIGLDPRRVAAFAFVAAALSAAWVIEDDAPTCIYDEVLSVLKSRAGRPW